MIPVTQRPKPREKTGRRDRLEIWCQTFAQEAFCRQAQLEGQLGATKQRTCMTRIFYSRCSEFTKELHFQCCPRCLIDAPLVNICVYRIHWLRLPFIVPLQQHYSNIADSDVSHLFRLFFLKNLSLSIQTSKIKLTLFFRWSVSESLSLWSFCFSIWCTSIFLGWGMRTRDTVSSPVNPGYAMDSVQRPNQHHDKLSVHRKHGPKMQEEVNVLLVAKTEPRIHDTGHHTPSYPAHSKLQICGYSCLPTHLDGDRWKFLRHSVSSPMDKKHSSPGKTTHDH